MTEVRLPDCGPVPLESKALAPMLLDARNASKLLCVSERTLWSLASRGDVRSIKIGRLRRYDPADLRQFIIDKKTAESLATAV